jgi:hypothetical protein
MQIPSPDGMDLRSWAAGVTYSFAGYNVGNLQDDNWRLWGMSFLNDPNLGTLHPPNPMDYERWQDYGYMLIQAINSAKGAPKAGPA